MTNRTNHSNCTHPKTPKARAACRRATFMPEGLVKDMTQAYEVHTRCSQCNDIDPEVDEDGYTTCCNEGTY